MADQAVTLSTSKVSKLTENEVSQNGGFTHRFEIDFTDINDSTFTTDGDTVTVTLPDTPADFVVTKALAQVVTAFATDGTLTVMAGTDGDPDNFITAVDAKTAGPKITAIGAAPTTLVGSFGTAADTLVARFTTQAATGAPADITAGKVVLLLGLIDTAKISA